MRGTGCALASAIAAQLALGKKLEDAVNEGRAFLVTALRASQGRGKRAKFLSF